MANSYIALRLFGSTSKDAITLVDETTFPIVISGLAAGDYEVGRARFVWSGSKTTVSGPPAAPELLPLDFSAIDGRAQGSKVTTFSRPWAVTPTAITITSQSLAGAFQMNADGVTLEHGPTLIDAMQDRYIAIGLSYSDANGGPYTFTATATINKSAAPLGGAIVLTFDVTPDLIKPVVTLGAPVVTATTVSVPISLSEGTGTLYYVNDPAASLTEAQIIAHASVQTRTISQSGAQTSIGFTGLTASTSGNIHVVHRDQANLVSIPAVAAYTTTTAGTTSLGVVQSAVILAQVDTITGLTSWGPSTPFNVGTGDNRALLFEFSGTEGVASTSSGGAPTIPTATFNGQALTVVGYRYNSGDRGWTAYAYLANPTSGSGTLSFTTNHTCWSMSVVCTEFNGAHQTTPPAILAGGNAPGAGLTAAGTTTVANSILYGSMMLTKRTGYPVNDIAITSGTTIATGHIGATDLRAHYYASAYRAMPTPGANNVIFAWPESGPRGVYQVLEIFKA